MTCSGRRVIGVCGIPRRPLKLNGKTGRLFRKSSARDNQSEAVKPITTGTRYAADSITPRRNERVPRNVSYIYVHGNKDWMTYPLPPLGFPNQGLFLPRLVNI